MIAFNKENHEYMWDGVNTPSVTKILQVSKNYTYVSNFYRERGTIIHKIAELYLKGILDEDTVDGRVVGYLDAMKAFKSDYPGLPPGIGEIKSGVREKWHMLQLAAYYELWVSGVNENGGKVSGTIPLPAHEVKAYHPVYRYCGTIDIVNNPSNDCLGYVLCLNDKGLYKIEKSDNGSMSECCREFKTLVSSWWIREKYRI